MPIRQCLDRTSARVNRFKWENHDCDDAYAVTAPVGSLKPNALCLNDMLGNVWEWCGDWYGKYSSGSVKNPTGPYNGNWPVARGGGWWVDPSSVRCGHRSYAPHDGRYDNHGFRLVRTR